MANNFVQDGDVIQWTNGTGSAVSSGQVVKVGPNMLGVALVAIANGSSGSVAVEGVFTAPKVSAAVFAQGEKLLFDVSAGSGVGAFDDSAATPATGDVMGAAIAWAAGANAEDHLHDQAHPGQRGRHWLNVMFPRLQMRTTTGPFGHKVGITARIGAASPSFGSATCLSLCAL